MTKDDILKLRLANQFLAQPAKSAEEVVVWMGSTQAQDYMGALWGIGMRVKDGTVADIMRAIQKHKIVRTWPQRGTIHFVHARDICWMLKLMAERVVKRYSRSYHQQAGITEAVLKKGRQLFAKALKGGKQLTRPELYEVLKKGGINPTNPMGYHLLNIFASQGFICFGPHRGKQATFALMDEWIPKSRELTYEQSLAEIALRYFTSHGPAQLRDFVWWSGLKVSEARQGIEMNQTKLVKIEAEGKTYWMNKKLSKVKVPANQAHLLPSYDEYLIAYKDRSAALSTKIPPGMMFVSTNGFFNAVIILDGQAVGVWRRVYRKGEVKVTTKLFQKVTSQGQKAIDAAIKRYQDFIIDAYHSS